MSVRNSRQSSWREACLVLPFRSTPLVWYAEYCRRGVANYQGTERVAKAVRVNIGTGNDAGDKRARKKGGNGKRQIWTMITCSLHWYVVICIFEMMRNSHCNVLNIVQGQSIWSPKVGVFPAVCWEFPTCGTLFVVFIEFGNLACL